MDRTALVAVLQLVFITAVVQTVGGQSDLSVSLELRRLTTRINGIRWDIQNLDAEVGKLAFQLGQVRGETSDLKGGIHNLTTEVRNELEDLGNEINSAVKVDCDVERHWQWARYGSTGSWMRVAYLNMTDLNQQCPSGFRLQTSNSKRLCQKLTDIGCTSITFPTNNVQYSRVCGQVRAYQKGTPDGFAPYKSPYYEHSTTIDGLYVDGVSITHGANPRKHIWTFAAALDSLSSDGSTRECPCTNTGTAYDAYSNIPPYVGTDYFCETASHQHYQHSRFYHEDPLWDGQGCSPTSSCCQFNSPPWFCKELPQPTTDDIEVRVCNDQSYGDEAIPFELIELYVQ